MFDHILFPTDGSDGATAVFDHVLDIAASHGAMVHILNVADTAHDSVTRIGGEIVDVLEREGNDIVTETAAEAATRNVSTTTEVLQGSVPETIIEYAERYDIDIVIMPTQGRTGIERYLLGSVTERVIRQSTVPVLSLHPESERQRPYPYGNVLVPTDDSDCANDALELGIDIASAAEATLHALSVVDITSLGVDIHSVIEADNLETQAERTVREAMTAAERRDIDAVGAVEHDNSVSKAIRAYVDEHDIDLIVIGTHGRTGIDRFLIGSTTERIVRTADVPVIAVPTRDTD